MSNLNSNPDFASVKRDNARTLQQPGSELWRHDLTVYYFPQHPCQLEAFLAQVEACVSEEEEADVIYWWWQDVIPAYVKYSNRGPETREDRKLRSLKATSRYYAGGSYAAR